MTTLLSPLRLSYQRACDDLIRELELSLRNILISTPQGAFTYRQRINAISRIREELEKPDPSFAFIATDLAFARVVEHSIPHMCMIACRDAWLKLNEAEMAEVDELKGEVH